MQPIAKLKLNDKVSSSLRFRLISDLEFNHYSVKADTKDSELTLWATTQKEVEAFKESNNG